jgi:hypothetical protein
MRSFDDGNCFHVYISSTIWQANSGAMSSVAYSTSSIQADTNGTVVFIGPVFTTQTAELLVNIAIRFGTSIKTLLKFNADLVESTVVQAGQQMCILPCKK